MTNYKKGVKFEYKIIKILKENLNPKKYTIIRTAGSHSPVDVIVLEHRRKYFGIQCKSKISHSRQKKKSLEYSSAEGSK